MKLVLDMRGGSAIRSAPVVLALLEYGIAPRSRRHHARKVSVAQDVHIRSDRGRAEVAAVVEANMARFALIRVMQGSSCMSVPGIDLPGSC